MKIVICTTPIRPTPTDYPPLGALAIIQSLRSAGYDPYFYDIDCLRPSFEETVAFLREQAPDVVGISAVVSTAYAYTKRLALAIREALPGAKIVVGGNLAASAEILLRLCKVDVCVVGEGEIVTVNLVRHLESGGGTQDLQHIKGLTYLNKAGDMVFTGYETQIPADELFEPDYSILEQYSKIEHFINDPLSRHYFSRDKRTFEPHRRGKQTGLVISAKGCVARCTFCHRWDKGYRHIPVDSIIRRIQYLKDRYNVGFIRFGDENFGSDRRRLEELIEKITPMDVLYLVGGVRARSVDLDLLKAMRKNGCVSLMYGMETGSPRMLEIMEKNTTLQQNINAARWTHEADLYTIYQFVIAMPGETHETINETLEFAKQITEFLDEPPYKRLSINYTQALPGTPVYEYARSKGLIGPTLEDEERYLLEVSDVNAGDDMKFLNFTEYDYFTVQSWRTRILFEAEAHFYRMRNWKTIAAPKGMASDGDYNKGGYFNIHALVLNHPLFYRLVYRVRPLYIIAHVIAKDLLRLPFGKFLMYLGDFLSARITKRDGLRDSRSLRKVMREIALAPSTESEKNMTPLREGR